MAGKAARAPETGICRAPHRPLVWRGDVVVSKSCHDWHSWEELRELGEDKTGDSGDIILARWVGLPMWCRVSGPKNEGDICLEAYHGFQGRESKHGRTVTAVSTSCSNDCAIFLLVVLVSNSGQCMTEVAGIAPYRVREVKVKVREVPESVKESQAREEKQDE